MVSLNGYTLNEDGLSTPIKRHIGRWIEKKKIQLSVSDPL